MHSGKDDTDADPVPPPLDTLRDWPWRDTLRTLHQRFREDRLGVTASSLTFTTLVGLVPLVTVMLAVFTAFPMFSSFQGALETYFLQSLVPEGIAKPVLNALTQFAVKARQVGFVGLLLLGASALALMLTIDRTLNSIWRVRKPRPITQRLLVYGAGLTLGPLALAVSLTMTSYAVSASRGFVGALPGGVNLLLGLLEFGLLGAVVAGLYRYVPNTAVRWRHAWAGGLFVALGFEIGKRGLAWYVATAPGFSAVYGAFVTLPILLLWIYLSWVIVLLGAVIAAYAPSLQMRVVRRADTPGLRFELALEMLRELGRAHHSEHRGLTLATLCRRLRADPLQLAPVIELLVELDWLARLDEPGSQRLVLLCDPASTAARPLVDGLLLTPGAATAVLWSAGELAQLRVADLLRG